MTYVQFFRAKKDFSFIKICDLMSVVATEAIDKSVLCKRFHAQVRQAIFARNNRIIVVWRSTEGIS
jgi:hypothetical protein